MIARRHGVDARSRTSSTPSARRRRQKFGTPWLGLTIPFPLYGIFRYLYLVHQREGGGSPADLLLTDRPLLACVALWALSGGADHLPAGVMAVTA